MKKSKKHIYFYFITFVSVAIFVVILLRPHSRLLLTLFPPPGLYNPLIKQSINLKKENSKFEREIDGLYVGTYFVGVYLNNLSSAMQAIDSTAILMISVSVDNNEIYHQDLTDWAEYVGGKSGRSELIVGHFKVPDDVPKMKPLKISIFIKKSDPEFDKKYGPLELFVQRSVDL